jgi:hypothetical protein
MALTYALGFNPFWYIADNVGRPLGGGTMYTYRSLAKTTPKAVYRDTAGLNPWTNPILFDENGQQGPFYFEVDSVATDESYYIEVYDAQGNLVWNIDNFLPPAGSGGGGGTAVFNVNNLVINGVFWRNQGPTASPIADLATVIAPGCHAGLSLTANNAGPDIVFLKNNLSATDQITFPLVTQGTQPLTGDVAPVLFLEYKCTGVGSGETQKCLQIPITAKLQNLTNIATTVTLWAKSSSLSDIKLKWLSYLGDGATSPLQISTIATQTLTAAWFKYEILAVVPDITAFTLGDCGNDGLFLQIEFPLDQTCDITLTQPSIFIGTKVPPNSFVSYDQIDGMLNVPRTGDVRPCYVPTAPLGWILMQDTTIGNTGSVAFYADKEYFPLYNYLYTNISNTWAPVSGGRSGNAVTDFLANKTLTMPRVLGRALASAGNGAGLTARVIGEFAGAETRTIAVNNLPQHTHGLAGQIITAINAPNSGGPNTGIAAQVSGITGGITGGTTGTAINILSPEAFALFMIKT